MAESPKRKRGLVQNKAFKEEKIEMFITWAHTELLMKRKLADLHGLELLSFPKL